MVGTTRARPGTDRVNPALGVAIEAGQGGRRWLGREVAAAARRPAVPIVRVVSVVPG